jgi:ATP-dependent Lhr-like helicase
MPARSPVTGLLGDFSEATRAWFAAAFAEPTPAQAQAWAAIGQGGHTLVVAPTGSGKTLAAFLWAIDKLITEPPPADPQLRCRVLYISPLKALAVDIERNLRSPLTGIGHATRRLGLPEPDVRVGVRTGDTAADERRRLAGKPPDILITTPESLFLLLTSKARDGLRGVETVIVDEVHALAGGKRGAHLALSLERLDALRRAGQPGNGEPAGQRDAPPPARPVQRIGLSATVRPPEEVAAFLGGAMPVTIVQPPSDKRLDLKIVVPVEDMADLETADGAGSGNVGAVRPGSGLPGSGLPGTGPPDTGSGRQGPPGPGLPGPGLSGSRPGTNDPGRPSGDPARRHSIWPHVEERVLDLIQSHKSTIVFANSRRLAERLCARLNELAAERVEAQAQALALADSTAGQYQDLWAAEPAGPAGSGGSAAADAPGLPGSSAGPGAPPRRTVLAPAEIMAEAGSASGAPAEVARAHHGSVSRQERTEIEEALKAGRLPAVVATSSLELGIDMGAVDLVVQVESPPSVASGLQRTGRAGHNVGDVSRGVIFPKYQGDLVQATVVAQRMRGGQIEELRMPRNPLDVLAQQIVAMTAMDDWDVAELAQTVRRAAPFSGLTQPVLEAVLDMLAGRYPSEDFAGLRPRLVWDRTAGTLRGRPGGQRMAVTNGGTIPDRGLFGVFLAGGQRDRTGRHSRRVGELDEEMVYESRVGDIFVLGASSWRIEDITADQVLVSPAPGQPGRLPFWHGDTPGRPAELGAAIGQYCRELGAASPRQATARLLGDGLDELAASNLLSYLASQREATGYLPDDRTLVLERFRDELGDWRLILHSPYGAKVHAPWALAIAARLRERYGGMNVQALHTDDGIVIRVPDADDPPPAGIAMLDPDEIEQLVTAELGASALFASRFRECAARALLLPRRQPGRRTPLWQQRQRSAQLLTVASQYSTFPIVLETVRECLQDVFDVPGLTSLMRDLAARRVRLVEVETPAASPFSKSLLFRYVGAFMYEGDAPLAERRAQALALDSALLAELLGQAEMRELLDPLIVTDTERELQRLASNRTCTSAEQLADLLRAIGPLSAAEVTERCAQPAAAPGWLAALAGQRRVIEVRVAGEARWAAIEDAGRLRDALGVALPPGIPDAFTEPLSDPLGDLVARYARTHCPFAAAAAAERYGLGVAVVTGTLHRLAADGRVAEGEFLPGGRGAEWCGAGVLRLLRRRSLAKLRKEAEPVPPQVLGAFLPAWQRAGQASAADRRPGHRARATGPDAVYDVIGQLAGAAVPASALESLVLPGRLLGYSAALLDELTAAGEVVWSGAGGLPGGDGWIVLAPADTSRLLLPPPGEITMTAVHEGVLAALDGGGALFFRAIADRVADWLRAPASGQAAAGGHAETADVTASGQAAARGQAQTADIAASGRATASGHTETADVATPATGRRAGLADDQAVASAIWDLVWAGRLTNDTLAPLRTVLAAGRPTLAPAPRQDGGRPAGNIGQLITGRAGRQAVRRPGLGRAVMPSRSGPPTVSGRWSKLPPGEPDQTRRMHALALALLDRHGIVIRGAAAAERVPGGFAALYPVLRAMEEAGQCRRGYFVEGLGAAQFALPGAVDRMRALAETISPAAGPAGFPTPESYDGQPGALTPRAAEPHDGRAEAMVSMPPEPPGGQPGPPELRAVEPYDRQADPTALLTARSPGRPGGSMLVLAAADPANAYGAALPWPARPDETPGGHRPGRKAGALVLLADGDLVLYVERGGKSLLSWTSDPGLLEPAAAAMAGAVRDGALGRLTVERADGGGVYDSPLARALELAGFRPTPRGLRLRG